MGNDHRGETPEQQIIARLDFIIEQLDDVLARLKPKPSAIQFVVAFKGKILGGNAMVSLDPVNDAYDIAVTGELAADGVIPVPLPTLAFQFAVSDPTLGIFTENADGRSGTFVANKLTASAAGFITITDPVVGITTQSHFTFTVPPPPPPPTAATIQFTESAPHPAV